MQVSQRERYVLLCRCLSTVDLTEYVTVMGVHDQQCYVMPAILWEKFSVEIENHEHYVTVLNAHDNSHHTFPRFKWEKFVDTHEVRLEKAYALN